MRGKKESVLEERLLGLFHDLVTHRERRQRAPADTAFSQTR